MAEIQLSPEPLTNAPTGGGRMTDEELLAAVLARGEDASSRGQSSTLLIVTAALFVGIGGMQWGWHVVIHLAVAIGLHELGHVLAMRMFGYKNVRMLFVPFFGGLATGEPRELDGGRNALVALAGPVAGLVTAAAAALIAIFAGRPSWLIEYAWIAVGLNAFNLLPFEPLDGGRFASDTLFSRHPVAQLVCRLLAVAVLGWLAWDMQSWLFAVLPWWLLMTLPVMHRRACAVREARRDPAWSTRSLDLEAVAELRRMVAALFSRISPEKYEAKLPEHVHGLWLEIRKRFPGPRATVALIAGYLVIVLLVVPFIAGFFYGAFGRPGG